MESKELGLKFRILDTILSYEVSKGHLKWKVSEVSRKLDISRNLIYYHFGKSKKDILFSCYQMVAEEFYGLKRDFNNIFDFENRMLEKSLIKTQRLYLQTPAIVTFFHRWRLENSANQKQILEMETKYQQKMQKVLPKKTRDEILAIHTIIHGIVTSPFANDKSISLVVNLIKPLLLK